MFKEFNYITYDLSLFIHEKWLEDKDMQSSNSVISEHYNKWPLANNNKAVQDCFLQKEARVCISNAFVLEDSMFK